VCVRFSSVAPPDRRVLCLYVGGTIGMSMTPAGFAPERGLLTHILRNNPKFHDSNLPCPPSGGVMPVVSLDGEFFCCCCFDLSFFPSW
jgi:hypothetical protein